MDDQNFQKWYRKRKLDKVYLIIELIYFSILLIALIFDFKVFIYMFIATCLFVIVLMLIELIIIMINKIKSRFL